MNKTKLENLQFILNDKLTQPSKSNEYLDNFIYTLTKQLSCFSIIIFKQSNHKFEPVYIIPKNIFEINPTYKFRLTKAMEIFYDKELLTIDNNFFHIFKMDNYGYMTIQTKNRKLHKKVVLILKKTIENFTHIYTHKLNSEKNILNLDQLLKHANILSQAKIITNISNSFIEKTNNINNSTTQLKINKKYNKLTDDILEECISQLYSNNDAIIRNINIFKSFSEKNDQKNKFTLKYLINKVENILNYTLSENGIRFIKNIEDIEVYTYENQFLESIFNIYDYIISSFQTTNQKEKIIYTSIVIQENKPMIFIYTNKITNNKQNFNYLFDPNFSLGLYFSKNLISKQINGMINVKLSNFTHEDILYDGLKFTIELKEQNEYY